MRQILNFIWFKIYKIRNFVDFEKFIINRYDLVLSFYDHGIDKIFIK